MPIYEYGCKNCGHEWEDIQRITDDPQTVCPSCGEPRAQRLISQTSFILKGSGWYVTDYGRGTGGTAGERKKNKPDTEKKESSTTSSKSDSSSKTDSKSSSSKD